jgi:hypothetical protein
MRKLLFGMIAVASLALTAPASAQFYGGVGPGGAGVQVGPFSAGVGPNYDRYWHHGWRGGYRAYGYAGECRFVRERIVTPSGRMIIQRRQVCD